MNSTDIPELSPRAPILPNVGLGEVRLRSRIADYQSLLGSPVSTPDVAYSLHGAFEVRHAFLKAGIQICTDIRNGRIFKINALRGYEGDFLGVTVGQTLAAAVAMVPSLRFDEGEGLAFSSEHPGVSFSFDDPDPPSHLMGELPIATISVFAVEAFTWEGQDGNW